MAFDPDTHLRMAERICYVAIRRSSKEALLVRENNMAATSSSHGEPWSLQVC